MTEEGTYMLTLLGKLVAAPLEFSRLDPDSAADEAKQQANLTNPQCAIIKQDDDRACFTGCFDCLMG